MENIKLYWLYFLAFISLLLYWGAFFPLQKNASSAPINPPTRLDDLQFDLNDVYTEEVDKIILIVIDALRNDFIVNDYMPFVVSKTADDGCRLTIHVESPTVTLPRIKALTTGGIPQFFDIVLNLASTDILSDSFLHQAQNAGKKMVFYGDDTWLKLYPDMFIRQEGVSSFYVNDYTEVDNNVTRNVLHELQNDDWDFMFLHYLGLDHIGHTHGPFSSLIRPKLLEMDKIIETMYSTANKWPKKTILLITGDHGMKDSRGHGGATTAEIYVPLVVMGLPCSNGNGEQSDIPVTLSSLLGLPIPVHSIGQILINFYKSLSVDRLLYALRYNALTLQAKCDMFVDILNNATKYHYRYLKTNNTAYATNAQDLYVEFSGLSSQNLIRSSVQQDIYTLVFVTEFLVICFSFGIHYTISKKSLCKRFIDMFCLTLCLFLYVILPKTTILIIIGSLLLLGLLICLIYNFKRDYVKVVVSYELFFMVLGTIVPALSLTSSSFIEEEHQIWYYLLSSFLIFKVYNSINKSLTECFIWFLTCAGFRIIRKINQTGDKWAHLPDLADWLIHEDNYLYLQLLFVISLFLVWFSCYFLSEKNKLLSFIVACILTGIFVFRTYAAKSAAFGKILWFFILITLGFCGIYKRKIVPVAITWILVCALVIRNYNIVLIPFCIFCSFVLNEYLSDVNVLVLVHLWLGNALYFCQGHSNSLASIDIASGYVGLHDYIPFIVGMQILCHTYAFPVLTNLLVLRLCNDKMHVVWNFGILCRLLFLAVICILTFIQRHHLFVWTVFTPKLIIESGHTTILFIQLTFVFMILFLRKGISNVKKCFNIN